MQIERHLSLAACLSLLLAAPPAQGDAATPTAPNLSMQAAHTIAGDALSALVRKVDPAARQKIVGAYVAFHADPRDPVVFGACDDDGDYVVVMSDAMLALADFVARAEASDEKLHTHALEQYAALLAKDQHAGERLLAPPPGFFDAAARNAEVSELHAKRFAALVTHLLAAELAQWIAGDYTCPAPTATHERGDDVWTAQEHSAALALAAKSHDPRRVVAADARGTALALAAGEPEDALAAFLYPFMSTIEGTPARGAFGYLRLHPASTVRAQVIRAAARSAKP